MRALCEVVARRREGAYLSLSVAAAEIADRALPGQFINVAVGAPGCVLRRPFSIHRTSGQGQTRPSLPGTVEFVFDAHGPGTRWLAERETHDVLDVVGPLGSPFRLPAQRLACLLVGGGYGTAPLFFLAEHLHADGQRVDMLVGAASADRILSAIEAKRTSASVTFTTEDGTHGITGRVTDVLEDVARDCNSSVVYACGPMPMLRAVAGICADLHLPCQVAVEEHMACGVGVCWTCVVPVRGKDGRVRMKRSCLDGPVFNGARIAWEESRFAPAPAQDEFLPVPEEVPVDATPRARSRTRDEEPW
ncbi:MAG TPA: dihydroorotate dehydrogenase electron transfer subunit [Nitriliruptorales bacterium]|nr:dihydroorotate dehydrogenase electron transfer subunit [Nitriliruptorales bacterium]